MKLIYIKALSLLLTIALNTVVYASENADAYYNTIFADFNYYSDYYAVKTDGTLYKIPYIKYEGEYELELPLNEMIPIKISENVKSVSSNCVLKEDGSVWEWNEDSSESSMIAENAKSIASCSAKLIVKNDGSLWGKGSNSFGQLAQGEMSKSIEQQMEDDFKWRNKTECFPKFYKEPVKIMDDVRTAVTDFAVSVVLKNDGTVWTFGGDNGGGTLGIGGKWLVNNKPTQILSGMKQVFIKGTAAFALDNDNTLWRWGSNYTGYDGGSPGDKTEPVKYAENVKYVTNMPGYNLIIKTDNSLWIYGDTDKDNGDIGYTSSDAPVKMADNVAAAVGLNQLNFKNDSILVLKENGDLMLFAVPLYDDKVPYEIGKIMGNIRLPDEIPANINFTDISDKAEEMKKAINSLSKAGIIDGITDTEFAPDKPVTRAEIAALLLRMTAKVDESGNGGFSDVIADQWYYNVAGASKKYGIVKGFEDNTFRGDENISKIQLVSLAARTLASERDYPYTVNEKLIVPEWAREDVSLAISAGLVDKNESFDGNITRGEAAVILYQLYGLI